VGFCRGSEGAILRSGLPDRRRPSPEKEERYYTTRGVVDNIGKDCLDGNINGEDSNNKEESMWPKLFITLSNKEKEEDFMAMKGCKPSHRPKKRAKLIQRSLLLVSPGTWLADLCPDRYDVRVKKSSKKV
jgi:mRNA deadenylase 3'-5' endonuclease subunit Ccr4